MKNQLKLKPEFEGKLVKRKVRPFTHKIFNTIKTKPEQYQKYKDMGVFDDMFEDVEEAVSAKKAPTPTEVEDFSMLTMKELRERFPEIKANKKDKFLEQIQ